MDVPTALDELYDWSQRHDIGYRMTWDKIPGEPIAGPDGQLWSNNSPGDLHITIDPIPPWDLEEQCADASVPGC